MADGVASSRTALAGNPSDGYGGTVLSLELPELCARASVVPGAGDVDPPSALVAAAVARFARSFRVDPGVDVSWTTVIPRSVGLAGSSAVVIAVARALCELHGISVSPDALAAFAHAVERVDLGIAGGRQDSVVQAYGGLIFMDFAGAEVQAEPLDPGALPPLLVAWRPRSAEDSGLVHTGLRSRFEAGDPVVRGAMRSLAAYGRDARDALVAGDHERFAGAVDATLDLRRRILHLEPLHLEMVECARAAGAAANYTGSGGAIIAVCRDDAHRQRVAEALRAASWDVLCPGGHHRGGG